MVSLIYILVAAACFLLWLFPGVRCALTHPFHCIYYGVKDGYNYIRYKQGNLRKTGNLDIFCGYFGNGKTLSLVKQVVCREYKRYDGLTVWCNRRQKFVSQRILILSNVDLCVPYERLTGLAQVCAISKANEIYDDEHDTLTITIQTPSGHGFCVCNAPCSDEIFVPKLAERCIPCNDNCIVAVTRIIINSCADTFPKGKA